MQQCLRICTSMKLICLHKNNPSNRPIEKGRWQILKVVFILSNKESLVISENFQYEPIKGNTNKVMIQI